MKWGDAMNNMEKFKRIVSIAFSLQYCRDECVGQKTMLEIINEGKTKGYLTEEEASYLVSYFMLDD